MNLFSKHNFVNMLFALAVIACAAAMARPLFYLSKEKRCEYIARRNAVAINDALTDYSQKHDGVYPPGDRLTGGGGDALVRGKILLRYPDNPFKSGTRMKKVPFGTVSPGDFSYSRDDKETYDYRFAVYGKRGIVFMNEMKR
jgi:hypothetical protein